MTKTRTDPILITGCGWITPLGAGTFREVLSALCAGDPPTAGDEGYWPVPECLLDTHPHLTKELKHDKGAWMTAIALEAALRDAGIVAEELEVGELGMVLGCALAGQIGMITFAGEVRDQTPRFVSPIHFPQTVGNFITGALARAYNIQGPNVTIASGVGSGLDAILEGCALLDRGEAGVILAGGIDALTPELALGLSEPSGVLSEGACLLTLERASHAADRGGTGLATVVQRARGAERPGLSAGGEDAIWARVNKPNRARKEAIIQIERSVGRCFSVLGPAALAAAIGVALGADVAPAILCGDQAPPELPASPDPPPEDGACVVTITHTGAGAQSGASLSVRLV